MGDVVEPRREFIQTNALQGGEFGRVSRPPRPRLMVQINLSGQRRDLLAMRCATRL